MPKGAQENMIERSWAAVFLLVAGSLLSASVGRAFEPAEHLSWPGWSIAAKELEERGALAIVEDEAAESKRKVKGEDGKDEQVSSALHQRVSRRAAARGHIEVARTPLIKWADVVPGIYRVSARIKFDGDVGVIGTPIRLQVNAQPHHPQHKARDVSREFSATDLGEVDTYQEISFVYEVSPKGEKRLPAREAVATSNYPKFGPDIYPDARPQKEENEQETAPPGPLEGFTIGLTLPQTKYMSSSGMPPNSLRWVRLDWIKLEKIDLSPSITVRYVRPDKLWLRPGIETGFAVGLENFTPREQVRTLSIVLERGFAERQVIHSETVELPPGADRHLHVPWQTDQGTPLYGYKVVAEIRQGNTVESKAHDYFQVHPDNYTVHIMGSNTRSVDPFRFPESYKNHMEIFASTPGDMSRIMPKAESWFAGMGSHPGPYTFKLVRAATEHNRKEGILTVTYLFAGGTGAPLLDDYVAHPEWISHKVTATDPIYRINHQWGEKVRGWDWEKKGPIETVGVMVPAVEMHLNHRFPELKARIEREFLEFVRQTGYGGVRFDVGIMAPVGDSLNVLGLEHSIKVDDPMAHAAKNFNDLRALVEAEYPDFEWGANMDSWGYLDTIKDRDIAPEPPEKYQEFVAFAQAHGMFMDEGSMGAPFWDHYMNKWEDSWYFMNLKRKITRRFGAVYQLFSPHRDGSGHFCHDDIYFATMIIASGSHYYGSFAAPAYSEEGMGAFATRFSEFIWHPELQPLEEAADLILVDAPADIWFAEGVVQQQLKDRLRYVIPLLNPPVVERLRRNKVNELPPPIDEAFPVEIAIPEGSTRAEAWMLTWEPRVEAVPLRADVAGAICTVTFPGLKIFRTLVVEFMP